MNLKNLLIKHWVALILAVSTSILVAFPQIYFRIEHRNDGIYQGIELLPDSPWSARVREIQDGHGFGSVPYKDGKDDPYLHVPLGSMVVAYMGSMFALDINNTLLLSRIVLPFLAFVLIYAFVFLFSRDRFAALSSASAILLADSIMDYSRLPRVLADALGGISPSSFLDLARPVYGVMIFVPFFGFMAAFWKFFRERKWIWGAASAVLLGLNFYNYFYTWTYLYAFGSLLILIFLIRKNWSEAMRITQVFIGALVVGIPYAFNLYRAMNHPLYEELGARHGIVSNHSFLFVGYIALASLIIFFLWFPREDRERYFFSLALLLTPFIVMNQQIVTGMTLQTGHYHWYFHKPIVVIFLTVVVFNLLSKRNWLALKRIWAILIISISFSTGIFVQAASYMNDNEGRDGGFVAVERQKYGPVMKWLNENASREAVVLANNEASHVTIIYTSLNAFHHRSAQLFLAATEERLLDAMFAFYRLRGVREEAPEVFEQEIKYISSNVYGIYYREATGSYSGIPDEKFEKIVRSYINGLKVSDSKWLQDMFKKYEVEYIIWDKVKDPAWKLDRFEYLQKVFGSGTMAIYKFNP
ncbi:MAG: hypothetical protein EXS69_02245 [Candidatus Zambryskibacteria bacterium]|nr:hypothetical protein [Candidatus Zambryskibacteria bacterium]